MIYSKRLILLFTFLTAMPLSIGLFAQKNKANNLFANQALLSSVFDRLYNLETYKKGKVNIVHIGDSHIQADIFTNTIRQALQDKYGNGGVGFSFPYSLVKTNGPRFVKYSSNATWQSLQKVSPIADIGVGLSGIALYTSADDFMLQLSVGRESEFNTIKIIYPDREPHYKISIDSELLEVVGGTPSGTTGTVSGGTKYHKVKRSESLAAIGRKYGVTAAQIKTANRLKSNSIHPGQTLKIPVKSRTKARVTAKPRGAALSKVRKSNLKEAEMDFVSLTSKPFCSTYTSDSALTRVTVMPDGNSAMYNLNGFVLENNKPGIIYHAIGVNGAQMSHYAKFPLFFNQLSLLEADLIILSFGTNESYGKMSESRYLYQLQEFVNNIRQQNKNAIVLVMTPPPSLFPRQRSNPYVAGYSIALMSLTNMPVWDLYSRMGGELGIRANGAYSDKIARDKVHYTAGGYKAQGELFVSDFIDAYNNYKKYKKN